MASEGLRADLAAAILDGSPIDWAAAESSADPADRPVLERLRILAAVVDLHRSLPHPSAALGAGADLANAESWGHLRVLERIGRGAFGVVYRAWDARLDREVALKLLPARSSGDADGRTAIIEEGRALARVRHPGVVTLYGAEVIDDHVGLWMELVRGRTLEDLVAKGKRWSAGEAAALGVELCRAVAAVHDAGLVHRDIKASNVMLQDDGRIVLMDFGTGRILADGAPLPLAGTPLYLAPELFADAAPSVASDVYSIGVLLYHLLTGSYPVRAPDIHGLRLAHQRGDRTPVREARPEVALKLANVIDRATDVDPTRRPTTAEALAVELSAIARPRLRAGARALAAAAALLVLLAVTSEIYGRLAGKPGPLRAMLASFREGLAGAAGGERAVETPTIVVLPFDDLSDGPESDAFVDGLADEILRDLARVEGLAVRSRYSSFTFRDPARDLGAIGKRLDAQFAVTGSALRSGAQLRVNAQLVDIVNDRPLWADRFDLTLTSAGDVFAVVDEIARNIVNELRLTLRTGQRRYDLDLDAYERYLEARTLVGRRGVIGPTEAVGQLEQIIADDPSFAPAYAAVADAYSFLSIPTYGSSVTPARALELMRVAAVRAIELDPLLAEAHAAMGVVHARDRDWRRSEQSFERALELDPTLTDVYTNYSFAVLRPLGRSEEALRLLARALENDPLSLDVEREIAGIEFTSGRYQEAIERLERLHALDPELPFVTQHLGRAMIFGGRVEEGLTMLDQDKASGMGNPHYRAHGLIRLGRREEVERLAAAAAKEGRSYHETVMYAALGDLDRAFEALERTAVAEPQRLPIALTYPELASLRGDPRLAAFRQRFGLP